jgi:hypothetical protein
MRIYADASVFGGYFDEEFAKPPINASISLLIPLPNPPTDFASLYPMGFTSFNLPQGEREFYRSNSTR